MMKWDPVHDTEDIHYHTDDRELIGVSRLINIAQKHPTIKAAFLHLKETNVQ